MSFRKEEVVFYWKGFFFVTFIKDHIIEKSEWKKTYVLESRPKSSFALSIYKWLEGYFSGEISPMDFPLKLELGDFYKKIYQTLLQIPYGNTISYGDLGKLAGFPKSARAIGQAMAKNPLPLFIPCHRVVGKNSLGGYSPFPELKKWLLELEKTNNAGEKQKEGFCFLK